MIPYSVAIPAWNAERTIGEALASVLAQSVAPSEIVVVDDGSTDGTVDAARAAAPGARIVSQANAGPGAATNRALQLLSAPAVAFLDADDLWLPEKMERQLALLAARPDVDLVACLSRQFHHGRPDDGTGEVRQGMTRSNIAARRAAVLATGEIYDPPGNRGDMVDWLARFREKGFVDAFIDEVLVLRGVIAGSLSHGRDPERDRGYLDVVRRAILRRRTARGDREASA